MTEKDQPLAAVGWMTAAILTGFMCFTQLGMMLSLLTGRIGIAGVAPAALVLTLILGDLLGRQMGFKGWQRSWAPGLALGVVISAVAVSAFYFDLSFDGQWYHQTAIFALARDWNPLTEPMREFGQSTQLWVRHYPKGTWYVAAAIYQTTGHIEWGKCVNWIALAAMGLAVFAAGLDWGLRRLPAAAIALVVSLNPVVMSELTTYMVDAVLMAFLTVVVAAMFSAFRRPQPVVVWVGAMATIVCINAKLTGLVFLCFVFAAGGLWCAFRHRDWLRTYAGWTALALLVGAGVFGFNPYVTNTIYWDQPFYPVLGSAAFPSLTTQGKEGIEFFETPKNLMGRSRFVRFGYAIFGRPGNAPYPSVAHGKPEVNAQLMWPFTARPADLHYYHYHETRVAGFGPFFSGAFLISLGLAGWVLCQRPLPRWTLVLSMLAIVSSLLISVHLWWPRYGPQLWLLPVLPAVFIFWGARSRWALGAAWMLVALLLLNAGIVAGVRMTWETKASEKLRQQLTELRESGKPIEITLGPFTRCGEERLKTWGIPYTAKGRKEIHHTTELMSVVEGYPASVQFRVLEPAAAIPAK